MHHLTGLLLAGMAQVSEIAWRLDVHSILHARTKSTMPATDNDTGFPFTLPGTDGKKVTAAFDGGLISSDGGVLLLAGADKRPGLTGTLAGLIPDDRDPARITHPVADIMRARVFAIACGYEDANDLDTLRHDPAFRMACGRAPESGDALASQPTISRLENAADLRVLIRMSHALVDLWCRGHQRPPKSITLDIDGTAGTAHGHYDERCFPPIHYTTRKRVIAS